MKPQIVVFLCVTWPQGQLVSSSVALPAELVFVVVAIGVLDDHILSSCGQ